MATTGALVAVITAGTSALVVGGGFSAGLAPGTRSLSAIWGEPGRDLATWPDLGANAPVAGRGYLLPPSEDRALAPELTGVDPGWPESFGAQAMVGPHPLGQAVSAPVPLLPRAGTVAAAPAGGGGAAGPGLSGSALPIGGSVPTWAAASQSEAQRWELLRAPVSTSRPCPLPRRKLDGALLPGEPATVCLVRPPEPVPTQAPALPVVQPTAGPPHGSATGGKVGGSGTRGNGATPPPPPQVNPSPPGSALQVAPGETASPPASSPSEPSTDSTSSAGGTGDTPSPETSGAMPPSDTVPADRAGYLVAAAGPTPTVDPTVSATPGPTPTVDPTVSATTIGPDVAGPSPDASSASPH